MKESSVRVGEVPAWCSPKMGDKVSSCSLSQSTFTKGEGAPKFCKERLSSLSTCK